MRLYTGADTNALMLSSGLEDYFLGTYYFDTGRYYADIAGLTHFDKATRRFSASRCARSGSSPLPSPTSPRTGWRGTAPRSSRGPTVSASWGTSPWGRSARSTTRC